MTVPLTFLAILTLRAAGGRGGSRRGQVEMEIQNWKQHVETSPFLLPKVLFQSWLQSGWTINTLGLFPRSCRRLSSALNRHGPVSRCIHQTSYTLVQNIPRPTPLNWSFTGFAACLTINCFACWISINEIQPRTFGSLKAGRNKRKGECGGGHQRYTKTMVFPGP